MKKTILTIGFFLMLFAFAEESKAQNNTWIFVESYKGVNVYWRYRQELKDQYISELKFENKNSYKVEIKVLPSFFCQDGTRKDYSEMMDTIAGYGTKAGQWEGYAWYPCDGTRPPSKGGFKSFSVKESQ